MGAKRWIIPHERMKNKPGADPRPHLVPITPEIASLLRELPRHVGGNFLFSETGAKPISGFGRAKAKLDALMRADLKANGHKPPERWTIHDVRRTCRTRFSALGGIPEHFGERLLAHAVPEIEGRYNLYGFENEKRAALVTWHRALRNIIEPASNVIPMRA